MEPAMQGNRWQLDNSMPPTLAKSKRLN